MRAAGLGNDARIPWGGSNMTRLPDGARRRTARWLSGLTRGSGAADVRTKAFNRAALTYVFGVGAQSLVVFLVTPIATRVLVPVEYGVLATAIAVGQFLTLIFGIGLQAGITRGYFAADIADTGASKLVTLATFVSFAMALTVALAAPVWSPSVMPRSGYQLTLLIIWQSGCSSAALAVAALARARRRATTFVAISLTAVLGGQSLGLLFAVIGPASAERYASGLALGATLAVVVGLLCEKPRIALPSQRLLRWAFSLSLPTALHAVGMQLLSVGDRVVIDRLLGPAEVATYHVAYLIGSSGIVLITSLNNAWAPEIYAKSEDDRWPYLAASTRKLEVLAVALVGIPALSSPVALRVLAPSAYRADELHLVVAVVSISAFFMVEYFAGVHILFQTLSNRWLAVVSPAAAVGNVALNVVLVDRIGLIGAAIATSVSYFFQAVCIRIVATRLAKVDWYYRHTARTAAGVLAVSTASALMPAEGTAWLSVRLLMCLAIAMLLLFLARLGGLRAYAGLPH